MGSATPPGERDEVMEEIATLLEPAHVLEPGTRVGDRFEIIERIGQGGMGVVYRARDAELDRDIAIKLRRDDSPGGRERLLGEARAMARLSHPNVVPAYELGTHEGAVFIAMELVEGTTLAAWLREKKRDWREVLAPFRDAAAGLIAIHRAGLLHRDFKPDNVLVGKDGRVRVTDLGLARAVGPDEDSAPSGQSGTPRYMSPEQAGGRRIDARSDQFSFCVALDEALRGVAREVPRRIRAAVERGLARNPGARHPSMEALVRALAWDPAVRRRRLLLAAIGVGLAGAAAWGALRRPDAPTACGAGPREAWSAAARAEARAAFLASGRSHAAETWSRAEKALDAYRGRYLAARTKACSAAETTPAGELEVACLDWRATGMAELVGQFRRADAKVVDRAIAAVGSLEPIEVCAGAATLLGSAPPPSDPALRKRMDAALASLEAVKAQQRAGRRAESAAAGRALLDEARAIGVDSLLAKVLVVVAEDLIGSGDYKDAEALLKEGLPLAARAGDRVTAAVTAQSLIAAVGLMQGRHIEAIAMIPAAEALAARAGELVAAGLDETVGLLWMPLGRYEDALAACERASKTYERAGAPTMMASRASSCVAGSLAELDRFEEAAAEQWRALEREDRELGPEHPNVGVSLYVLGDIDVKRGRLDEAEAAFRRARGVLAATYGPDSLQALVVRSSLAEVDIYRGRAEESLAPLRGLLPLYERLLGPDHALIADVRTLLGIALLDLGRLDEAKAAFEGGSALYERVKGLDNLSLLEPLLGLAEIAAQRKQPAAVRANAGRALSIARKVYGPEDAKTAPFLALLATAARLEGKREQALALAREGLDYQTRAHDDDRVEVARARVGVAEVMVQFGQNADAIALLERALPALDRSQRSAYHGTARLLLARAHLGAGEKARAVALARAAEEECRSRCRTSTRSDIAAWLRAHGG